MDEKIIYDLIDKQQKISISNKQEIAVLNNEIKHINAAVLQIRDNHLAHIQADLTSVKSQLEKIHVSDGKQAPLFSLAYKILEYTIIFILGAFLAVVIKTNSI